MGKFPIADAEMGRVVICRRCKARNKFGATICRACGYRTFRPKRREVRAKK